MKLRMEIVRADSRKDWALILRGKDDQVFFFRQGTPVDVEITRVGGD